MSIVQPRLAYNYAIIDQTGYCHSVVTSSYQVPLDTYISIPSLDNVYKEKYYNRATDLWYMDSGFTIEATEANEMYHG